MKRRRLVDSVFLLSTSLCLTCGVSWAETGVLVLHLKDVQQHAVSGLQIGTEEQSSSDITNDNGIARIVLARDTKEGSWVSLQILKSPPGKDFVIVSPWNSSAVIPSFEDESHNFVDVVVLQRGDPTALESNTVLAAATAMIIRASAPNTGGQRNPQANLAPVAKHYGLDPGDLDRAIRSWGQESADPYEVGLADLYASDYPQASSELANSLAKGEEKADLDRRQVVDAAFFLGSSLWSESKYQASVTAYLRCLELRPDDVATLNNLAVSLHRAGNYPAAEPLYRRALAIREKTLGPEHPDVATTLNNLAGLLDAKGDYPAAEPLYQRALAIREKAFGPDNPDVAFSLDDMAELLADKGDSTAAEPLYQRALAIREKTLGPDHPDVATTLNNLGVLSKIKGDYAAAEPLYRRALAIREKALGPEHPDVATSLNNLAGLLDAKGDYTAAELLYRRALAIREKALVPDHPAVATSLNSLAVLSMNKGDYATAELLYRRALAIREKALGPDHPAVATTLNNLALLSKEKGDYAAAEPLYRRALAIWEKVLGPESREQDTAQHQLRTFDPLYTRASQNVSR
jgi:tetratricopeptide (TPR) repeat protein